MEATTVYWGFIGIMEKNMEATLYKFGFQGLVKDSERARHKTVSSGGPRILATPGQCLVCPKA